LIHKNISTMLHIIFELTYGTSKIDTNTINGKKNCKN
jgi:hypothetical protein